MKRTFAASLFATGVVLTLAIVACDNNMDSDPWPGGAYGGGQAYCPQASTCDTCTPLNGCGWCGNADGTGQCVASPDQCAKQEFSWTWDATGCRSSADASVITPGTDSGTQTSKDSGSTSQDSGDTSEAGEAGSN